MNDVSAAPAVGPALTALRRITAERHAAIEALLQLAPSSLTALDMARYTAVLRGFERFLAQWEPCLLAALPLSLHGWFRARSRHAFVQQDLHMLAPSWPTPQDDPRAARQLQLHVPDQAAAWGSMYVLEGSALGGQVIARALAQQHGLDAQHGARYFSGHGAETARMWREFREQLGHALDADPMATARACTAAVATFDALMMSFRSTPGAVPLI